MKNVKLRTLTLTLALAVALLAAPAAHADLRISPRHAFLVSPDGAPAVPERITVTVTCASVFGVACAGPDTATINISITPTYGGSFSQTNDCPPTMTGTTLEGVSCTVIVGFTPLERGSAYAKLNVGTATGPFQGTVSDREVQLAAYGETARASLSVKGGSAKKRKCGQLKKKSARKKCRAKKKR